jgi:hypothetical protein
MHRRSLLSATAPAGYYGLGELAGKAFSVGKELLRP